ncbi:hypothetical protein RZE82_04300 [Mollicutes bacterium LVI A0039]|nr:hypothetical protein RZE82_04300 [Mollicutes bacterium LVI A0039]
MNNIHLIGHTHWDREWYFSTRDSYVLLTETFKRVVETLERNPEETYILDAQSSIIEDFLKFVPSYEQRVKNLIANKQLFVGPWYTQTDCLYVGAESIIQNLKVGLEISRDLGSDFEIGYLPDTFGFNIQMPSILKSCGIDKAVIRRGVDYDIHETGAYFKWKALNEEVVKTIHLYKGYGELGAVELDKGEKLTKYIDTIKKYTDSQNFVCLCGGDQTEINTKHSEIINQLNSEEASYNLVNSDLDKVFNLLTDKDYKELQSDLRIGSYDRVHRSIGSSRYDIKQLNFELENRIYKITNPMIAIAKQNGIVIETELIKWCLKKLFENQAHDSMGGCVTDEVYEDIIFRFKEVREVVDGIENMIAYRLHEQLKLTEEKLIVFNPQSKATVPNQNIKVLSYSQNIRLDVKYRIVNRSKVSDFSEQGYHYIFDVKIEEQLSPMNFDIITIGSNDAPYKEFIKVSALETPKFKIAADNNQISMTIGDKFIPNWIRLYDCGNDGDTYDYSPLRGDEELIFDVTKCNLYSNGSHGYGLAELTLALPSDLEQRVKKQKFTDNKVIIRFDVTNDGQIDFAIEVDNQSLSHRLRVSFDTGIYTPNHYQSVPFTSHIAQDHELVISNFEQRGYVEDNLDNKVFDNIVAKQNEDYAYAIQSYGSKEYQVNDSEFIITLFATTSEFGKGDLLSRPGRASGDTQRPGHKMIATPKAEYLGVQKFRFTINIAAKLDEVAINQLIDAHTTAPYYFQKQLVDKFINRLDNKLFDLRDLDLIDKSSINLETPYPMSNIESFEEGYLIRLTNGGAEQLLAKDAFAGWTIVAQTNCLGEVISSEQIKLFAKTCSTFYIKPNSDEEKNA